MKKFVLVTAIVTFCSGTSMAYDVQIDDFANAVNTTTLTSIGPADPQNAADANVSGVLGGSRALYVEAIAPLPILTQAGVIAGGLFDYMSFGTGIATVTYDAGGLGFGNAIACAEAIEVSYQDADLPAQGVGTGPALIEVALDGVPAALPVTAASGTLSFPIAGFVGPDLENLGMIELSVDGAGSDSADLAISNIAAVGCEPPEVPSPAMGAGPLAFGALLLAGLGLLGVARRRAL